LRELRRWSGEEPGGLMAGGLIAPKGHTAPPPWPASWRATGVRGVASRCCSKAIAVSRLACFRKLARFPGTCR